MSRHVLDVAALYADLDARRERLGLSWRDVAAVLDVSPSLFTRLAGGHRPDADGLVTLCAWLQRGATVYTVPSGSCRTEVDGSRVGP